MRLSDFQALSFDCYGTLIDWETGIVAALKPLIARTGREIGPDEALDAFSRHESKEQGRAPRALYPEILARVHDAIAHDWQVDPDPALAAAFGASVSDWPAFPDSAEALKYLKQHYRLIILSNVDRESFAGSNKRLQVEFDAIYTAQDVGSYKPDPRNFEYLIEHVKRDFGIDKGGLLHTAESLFHDHVQAGAFGLARAWIHRRADKGGYGATRAVGDQPQVEFYFKSLGEMAEAHRAEQG
jgi:2-haloalkanoic acid dehalogenase type II